MDANRRSKRSAAKGFPGTTDTYKKGGPWDTEPRLLLCVIEDLEHHIALREAFRKLMGAKRDK